MEGYAFGKNESETGTYIDEVVTCDRTRGELAHWRICPMCHGHSSWWVHRFCYHQMVEMTSDTSAGYCYNQLGGADGSCIVRNIINALGYNTFTSGAAEVALGFSVIPYQSLPLSIAALANPEHPEYSMFWKWIAVLIAVISTTAHAQDMQDQDGDGKRGRHTVPLVIGDGPARLTLALGVISWSIICCVFWDAGIITWNVIGVLALVVSWEFYMKRTVAADKMTYLLWNGWLTAVYMLPLWKIHL